METFLLPHLTSALCPATDSPRARGGSSYPQHLGLTVPHLLSPYTKLLDTQPASRGERYCEKRDERNNFSN